MSHLDDGDRKVTDDREKAEVLNRTFGSKFSDPSVTEFPRGQKSSLVVADELSGDRIGLTSVYMVYIMLFRIIPQLNIGCDITFFGCQA